MARRIKETPVLKGRDAGKFLAEINKAKNVKASPEVLNEIKKNYEKLKDIATF